MATGLINQPPTMTAGIVSPGATAKPLPTDPSGSVSTGVVATPKPLAAPVQSATPVTNADARVAQATAQDADVNKWDVNKNQTVAGQVQGLINANDPLQQQAMTMANQEANKRGLLDSSMAVGSARDAQNRAALPIAQQDAATFGDAARFNADSANAIGVGNADRSANMSQFNTSAQNAGLTREDTQQFDITKMGVEAQNTLKQMGVAQQNDLAKLAKQQGYNIETMSAAQINDLEKIRVDNTFKEKLSGLDNANRIELANIQGANQALLGTNKIAADLYTSVLDNITAIQSNPDIDGVTKQANGKTAKQNAIDQQTQLLQGAFAVTGGIAGMNISDLLGFDTAAPSGTAPAGTAAAAANNAAATTASNNEASAAADDLAARQATWDAATQDASQWGSPAPSYPRPTV